MGPPIIERSNPIREPEGLPIAASTRTSRCFEYKTSSMHWGECSNPK